MSCRPWHVKLLGDLLTIAKIDGTANDSPVDEIDARPEGAKEGLASRLASHIIYITFRMISVVVRCCSSMFESHVWHHS